MKTRNSNRNGSREVRSALLHLARIVVASAMALLLPACSEKAAPPAPRATDVTVMSVTARDVPVDFEFVAQTKSVRQVEIRARVEGFLDKRVYKEGDVVRAGQLMFQMDRRPFEAALVSAKGQLAQAQARLEVAKLNLGRTRPLAEQNAVSKKDLDDAIGAEQAAQAAVQSAQGQVQTAQLNLGYTSIASPLTGLSSFARKQEGSYVTPGPDGLLTTVSALDPMEVNFSVSENELLRTREDVTRGRLKWPDKGTFEVEVILADGEVYPNRGHITFVDPSFNPQTGTFLVRAEVANPKGVLKPGQFVRAKAKGAVRSAAIVVPQRAVLQGAKSHFVWVVNKEGKAEQRVVEVGQWNGDDWFVNQGLKVGERIVIDGAIRVSAGAPLKIAEAPPTPTGSTQSPVAPKEVSGPNAGEKRDPSKNEKVNLRASTEVDPK